LVQFLFDVVVKDHVTINAAMIWQLWHANIVYIDFDWRFCSIHIFEEHKVKKIWITWFGSMAN